MNHRFYLKIVAFAVIVTGFSIVYSLYSTPRVETIDYTELEVFINTSKIVYEVGEEINATIYLRNPYNYTIYVDRFGVNFVGYIYESSHPAQTAMSIGGEPIMIPAQSYYRVKSSSFKPDKAGIFYLSLNNDYRNHVYVINGFDAKYWSMKPELIEGLPSDNANPDVDFSHWFAVASKLNSLRNTGKLDYFQGIFVQMYPDWVNGTSYITLTDTSEYFTQPILEQFSEYLWDDIRFIKAPTTLHQLKEWEQMVWDNHEVLKEHGIVVWESSVFFDGRILLGIENADIEKVEILTEILVEVPQGVLVVYPCGPIVQY